MTRKTASLLALLLSLLLSTGCSGLQRKPVPAKSLDRAIVPGYTGTIRTWLGKPNDRFSDDLVKSVLDESPGAYRRERGGRRSYSSLVVSGGADYGAFGAGFLKGWTESGKRPVFKSVTGVSTGSLIAPFAFLGSDYDDELEESYTTISAKDIFRPKLLSGALFGESLTDTAPLKRTIEKYITDGIIDRVAEEYHKGRRLFVGTTNLDAERFTVWNMGLIAVSKRPDRYALFRKILLASSAIPGAFPPVHIDVVSDGVAYEEMHVDGGTITQMFFTGSGVDYRALAERLPAGKRNIGTFNLYIIRNGKITPDPRPVEPNLVDISGRSLALSIKSSGFNDLYRIYSHSQQLGLKFHYVSIPADYRFRTFDLFDQKEMQRLFRTGYEMGRKASPWKTSPPGLRDFRRQHQRAPRPSRTASMN
jgi:hypothetical protein